MFTPRQWEMLASDVRSPDDGRGRDPAQQLYAWAGEDGHGRAQGRRGLLPAPPRPAARRPRCCAHIRDNLGLSKAAAVLSGGSGLSPELFRLLPRLRRPAPQHLRLDGAGLVSAHREGEFDPATMGELLPIRPDHRAADRGLGRRDRASCACAAAPSRAISRTTPPRRSWVRPDEGYRTGDAVRLDERGELVFLDRMKDHAPARDRPAAIRRSSSRTACAPRRSSRTRWCSATRAAISSPP